VTAAHEGGQELPTGGDQVPEDCGAAFKDPDVNAVAAQSHGCVCEPATEGVHPVPIAVLVVVGSVHVVAVADQAVGIAGHAQDLLGADVAVPAAGSAMEDSEGLSQLEFFASTQVLIASWVLPGVDAELIGPVDDEEGAGQFADAAGGPVTEQHRAEVGRRADDQVRVEQDDEEGSADDGLVGSFGVFGVGALEPWGVDEFPVTPAEDFRRGSLRLGGHFEQVGDSDVGVNEQPFDEGRLPGAVVTGQDDAGWRAVDQRPDRGEGIERILVAGEVVEGGGDPGGAGAGHRDEPGRFGDRPDSGQESLETDRIVADGCGVGRRLGFGEAFGVGAPAFAEPQEPSGSWFTGVLTPLQVYGDLGKEMAGVGHFGEVFGGLLQISGGGGGGPGDATKRQGLRHIIGESFVRRLRKDPSEVLADDPFEVVEGVGYGSAAFRPGVAQGADPVGSGLLAELSADEADDRAADDDGSDDPSGRVPTVDEGGGEECAAAADAEQTAAGLERQTDGSGGLASGGVGAFERADGGAQVGPHIVGHQFEPLRQVLLQFASDNAGHRFGFPPGRDENLSIEHLRNKVFFGFERRFDKAVGAAERLHSRVPQTGGEPVTGMAEQLACARSAEPAAELLESLDAFRQILVGGPADEPEDVGDAPFQLLGEHSRFVVFSADRRFSVGEQAPGLLVEHAESQRCGVPRQGLSEKKLQRRQVGPCEQPLQPVLVPLLLATDGVGTGIGVAGAGEGGPFAVDSDDGDVRQVDHAKFVADVAHVLMDRLGQVPPARLASHSDGMAPAGVPAVEDGHHRLAVAADPLRDLRELSVLLTLGVEAEDDDVGVGDGCLGSGFELGPGPGAAPPTDAGGVGETATAPVHIADVGGPVAFGPRDRFAMAAGEGFDEAGFAGAGAAEKDQVEGREPGPLAGEATLRFGLPFRQ